MNLSISYIPQVYNKLTNSTLRGKVDSNEKRTTRNRTESTNDRTMCVGRTGQS